MQVTVHDGDMIAIGGAILEQHTDSTAAFRSVRQSHPGPRRSPRRLEHHDVPNRTHHLLTPRVIYDTNRITEATEGIKEKLTCVEEIIKDQ